MCELNDDANLMELERLLNDGQFLTSQSGDNATDVDENMFHEEVSTIQSEKDVTVEDDEPHESSETNYLGQNKKYQEQLHFVLEALQDALDQNLTRQNQIDEELLDLPVIVEPATPQQHVSVSKKSLTVFCAPYFKNHRLYSHPKNPDTIKKEENKELDVYTSNPAKWTDSERKRLKIKVRENALMKDVEYNEWTQVKRILIQDRNKSRLTDDEKKDLTTKITWADEEARKISELKEGHLFNNKAEDFDWDKISLEEFPRLHSAKSCELQWKNCIHPSWNQTAWSQNEDELLKVLADITDGTDWDFIAEELETERTPISCMQRLMMQLNKADSKRSWDTDEDELLIKLIGEHRINNLIPWSKLACHMERRRKEQCWQRYIYSVRDGITRGVFTEKEDMLLLAAVEMHGEDWVKIGSHFSQRTPVQLFSRWKAFLKADFRNWTREEDEELMQLVEKQGEKNWRKISREMSSGARLFSSSGARLFSNIQVRQRYTTIKAKYEKLDESRRQPRLKYKNAPGLSRVRQNEIYKKTREEYDNWSENYEMETEHQEENQDLDLEKDAKRGFLGLFNDVGNHKLESFMRHVQGLIALSAEKSKEKLILEKSSDSFDACKFEMPPLSEEEAYQMRLASECISKIGDFPILNIMSSDSGKETGRKKNRAASFDPQEGVIEIPSNHLDKQFESTTENEKKNHQQLLEEAIDDFPTNLMTNNSLGQDNFEEYVSNQEIDTDPDIMDDLEVNGSSTKETMKKINPRWRRFGQLATCGDMLGAPTDDNPEKAIKMTLIPPNQATVTGYRELLLNHMRFESLTLAEFLKETPGNKPIDKKRDCDALSSEEACDPLSPDEADKLLSRRFVQLFLLPAKMAVVEPRLSISPVVAPDSEPVLAYDGVVEPDDEAGLSNKEVVASVNKPELSNCEVVAPAQVPTADAVVSQSWMAKIAMSNGKHHAPDEVSTADAMVSQSWMAKIAMSNGNHHAPNKVPEPVMPHDRAQIPFKMSVTDTIGDLSILERPVVFNKEMDVPHQMSVAAEPMMPIRKEDLPNEMSDAELLQFNMGLVDPIKLLDAKTVESHRANDNSARISVCKNGVSANANNIPAQVPAAKVSSGKTVLSDHGVVPFQEVIAEPLVYNNRDIDPADVLISKPAVSNKEVELPAQELEIESVVTNIGVDVSTQVLVAEPALANMEMPRTFKKRKYLFYK